MPIRKRSNTWHFRMRVPLKFADRDPRTIVEISLGTEDKAEALALAADEKRKLMKVWRASEGMASEDEGERYRAGKATAQTKGFRFMEVDKVAQLPIRDLLARVEAARRPGGGLDPILGPALLGTIRKPVFRLSAILDLYWAQGADLARGKSKDQIRRWKAPRNKAFKNLIACVGDLEFSDMTPDDLLDFRAWWWEKVEEDGRDPTTANKDFTYVAATIRLVAKARQIPLHLNFTGLNFAKDDKTTRVPFSAKWLREKLCAPGSMGTLNTEARCIVLGMVNTGYRPSEGQSLTARHIRLDATIPHISIEPDGRTLKTQASRRMIPLTGVSLEAFRECPEGFPRYHTSANLSAVVNKYLRENGLIEPASLESNGQRPTLYSLRHSFEDRLLQEDVDERIRRDLMGHSLNRERYGAGATMEKQHAILQSIAI